MAGRALKRSAPIAGMFLFGVGVPSCSLAFDLGREQCETAEDCTDLGLAGSCVDKVCVEPAAGGGGSTTTGQGGEGGQGGVDPQWDCIPGFQPPMPVSGEPVSYHYRIELATSAGDPPPGLTVQLCALLDVACANPLPLDPPDATGSVFFELPYGQVAYLDIDATELMPSRAYLPIPPVVLPPKEKVIRVVRTNEFNAIVISSGQTYDPTRGVAIMLTQNCDDDRAAGVTLETASADGTTIPYYFAGQLPNFEVTQTDGQGAGGWVNLPVTTVQATARRASNGQLIGTASFASRPGGISYVPIGPSP